MKTGGDHQWSPSGLFIYRTPIFDFSGILESSQQINMRFFFEFCQIFISNKTLKVKGRDKMALVRKYGHFSKSALLQPILTLEFFPLVVYILTWPWMKYISFFSNKAFLVDIFFQNVNFELSIFRYLRSTNPPQRTRQNIFFVFFFIISFKNVKK